MNKTLWLDEKKCLDAEADLVNKFTAGKDRHFDLKLASADVQGSLAHARMLFSVGLISAEDWKKIEPALNELQSEIASGKFEIGPDVEDIHSQVELILTQRTGESGKKIHTGRSRNDQVLTDLKIFFRTELQKLSGSVSVVFGKLSGLSEQYRDYLLPGYTHFQVAMPSSFGLWFGAYAESLCDDLDFMLSVYRLINRNPLGSGAGFGSPFPLDREMTTELLGFNGMNVNAVYAQMTRGKTERHVATALANLAQTLSRFSYDVCLYMGQNFGFISFPAELCTGSSIMPHKKNPDVFELIRARCNRIQALPNELTLLTNNLPSGYHRDMQLTKEILFPAIESMFECLLMLSVMLDHISVAGELLQDEKYDLLFTVEEVNRLVLQGSSFREAYMQVAREVREGAYSARRELGHTHTGSIGNTGSELVRERFNALLQGFQGIL